MSNYLNNLKTRYATKRFDSSKKLTEEQLELLISAMHLAPSSYGLQPYKVVHVKNQEIKESLVEHSYNQTQVADCSDLFVLCIRTDIDEHLVNNYVKLLLEVRNIALESIEGYKNMMLNTVNSNSSENLEIWAKNQAYIVLGFLLDAAAQNNIDSCPMEGFDSNKYDEILNLKEKNLKSVVVCPVGFRSNEDLYANLPKVRVSKADFVIEVK
jgi:nitroreductase/dihydropteridine reductase